MMVMGGAPSYISYCLFNPSLHFRILKDRLGVHGISLFLFNVTTLNKLYYTFYSCLNLPFEIGNLDDLLQ